MDVSAMKKKLNFLKSLTCTANVDLIVPDSCRWPFSYAVKCDFLVFVTFFFPLARVHQGIDLSIFIV